MILVKVVKPKNTRSSNYGRPPRTFIVSDADYPSIIGKYQNLKPAKRDSQRFFLRYAKGRCYNQVIGKSTFAEMPKEIATFLKLSDETEYTVLHLV